MNILIRGCTVLPMSASSDAEVKFYQGNIGIVGNKIAFVSADEDDMDSFIAEHQNDGLEVIDAEGMVAMPGLINLHNHVSMALMRSYADDMALWPWLTEKIWPFEAKLSREDIKLGAELGVAEMLLGGTTTFVDMYWETDMVAEAAEEAGMRAVVSASFIDGKIDKAVADAERAIAKYPRGEDQLIEIRLAPHAPYTCSPDTIKVVLEMAKKYGLATKIHLSETETETNDMRERYGKTSTEYLRDLGFFDVETLAVHCVHVTDKDMDILAKYGVGVGHNPQSNMKLASGVAPIAKMVEKGIVVGIGTDGPSSNNDLDMWEELRSASFLQKVSTGDPCALPAYQMLQMVTVNGAKALGKDGRLGVITQGAFADIILIDTNKPHLQPCHDLVSNLAYCCKASDVETVIVGGEVVVRDGELVRTNTQELFERAQSRVNQLKV